MHNTIQRIRKTWHAYAQAFCKLTRIQFSAPWQTSRPSC